MGQMRLYAISIDQVRDIFAAQPPLSDTLKGWCEELISAENKPRRERVSRLRTYSGKRKRSGLNQGEVSPNDVADLLAGRFITIDRLPAAWRIFEYLLEKLSLAHTKLPSFSNQIDNLEFLLAKAGLSSTYAIRSLSRFDPQIPLLAEPGKQVGYSKYSHVLAAGKAISQAVTNILKDPEHQPCEDLQICKQLASFLTQFETFTNQRTLGAEPDLFVINSSTS